MRKNVFVHIMLDKIFGTKERYQGKLYSTKIKTYIEFVYQYSNTRYQVLFHFYFQAVLERCRVLKYITRIVEWQKKKLSINVDQKFPNTPWKVYTV